MVQIPARECVGYAINRLGFRELLIHYIGRLGSVTGNIVLGSLLHKLRTARIAQVILYQCNILAFDGDIAIKMHVGIGPVVLRDLCGNKSDFFNIILSKGDARKLSLDSRPIVLEDFIPSVRTPRHNVGAIGPRNNALVHVIEAILAARPCSTSGIHHCDAKRFRGPVARVIRVGVFIRIEQIVNARLISRFFRCDNRHIFRRRNFRTVDSTYERNRDRCRSLANARNVTAVVNR